MKTLVIFDVDNTLVYSDGRDSKQFAEAFCEVFNTEQAPSINWNDYTHVSDHTIIREAYKRQFGEYPTPEQHELLIDNYVARLATQRQIDPHGHKAVPNAAQTVLQLLEEGYLVGLATGGLERPAKLKLRHIGLNPDVLYGSYADGRDSREDIINGVFEQLNLEEITRIVYIGDAPWDVSTTRNMNLPLVGIRRRGDVEALLKEGASHVLADYLDYAAFKAALHEAIPPITPAVKVVDDNGEFEDGD